MRHRFFTRRANMLTLAALLLALHPAAFRAAPAPVVQASNVGVNGFYSVNRAQRGRTFQGAVVLDIPSGYHVNANRPLSKFAVPTTINVEAPRGFRVSAISFPRAVVRRLKSSQNEQLAVYEGRAVMRFSVTVPADFAVGVTELRLRVRFQSCTDEVCFPPATRNITLPIGVVNAGDPVERINDQIFGSGRRR